MKTFISDIIPKIQAFSKKLDNLTLLTGQHWVIINEIETSKNVYIFRSNNELLISNNGKVEKAKWEYLGHGCLLVDIKEESYLFKHGFFDENILALKVDGKEEYAFLVNETRYGGDINSIDKVMDFLQEKYINSKVGLAIENGIGLKIGSSNTEPNQLPRPQVVGNYTVREGELTITREYLNLDETILKATLNGKAAPDGKYKLGFMVYVKIKGSIVVDMPML